MKTTKYSINKEGLLKEISENSYDGLVCLLFRIDKEHRKRISKTLRQYGEVLYDQFPWARYLAIEIRDPKKINNLVEHLYSKGIKGVLDVDVDSRTLVLADNYSKEGY